MYSDVNQPGCIMVVCLTPIQVTGLEWPVNVRVNVPVAMSHS